MNIVIRTHERKAGWLRIAFWLLPVVFSSSPCAAQNGTLVLSAATIDAGSTVYQAQNAISNTGSFVIENAASVLFQAGSSISLMPGFHAIAGSGNPTFHALINPSTQTTGTTTSQAPPSSSPLRDYIRMNGQVIAIENH